jgi:GGDEF domain-containing protein
MARIKPIALEAKYGIFIGIAILLTAIFAFISKWNDLIKFFVPNGVLLNWRFVIFLILFVALVIWFILNHFWQKEHKLSVALELKMQQLAEAHRSDNNNLKEDYEIQIDNLRGLLRRSKLEYLSDPITGVPNVKRLEQDFEKFFLSDEKPLMQFIFIDLKNFGEINKTFLSQKTNKLIKHIAQDIYLGMRRNENMFKFPASESKEKNPSGGFYRIFPGGDEFVFILDGDQSEALGFINRLFDKFQQYSEATKDILGEKRNISFYCSVVQVDLQDRSFADIFERAELCYRTVWNVATSDFAISWFPDDLEKDLSKDPKKAAIYAKTKKVFEVVAIV